MPKLIFQLYNMALNNMYKMYTAILNCNVGHGQCGERVDAWPVSEGGGDEEDEGRVSQLDEVVWVADRQENPLGQNLVPS